MSQSQNKEYSTNATDSVIDSIQDSNSRIDQIISIIQSKFFAKKSTVALINLHGVVGRVSSLKSGMCISVLNELIEKAFKLPKLKAIALSINSPGGSPVQSELIASRIIFLSKKHNIPVLSFVEDVAASGGYWLACAGSEIYASKSSIIGSIGVISSSFGFAEAINKLGIERRIYTQGSNKSILDPFTPAKKSDIDIIKKLQKQIHDHFISYVKSRRAGKLTQNDDILFSGEFWSGDFANDFGLIDGIGNMYEILYDRFGEDITIECITPKQSWLKKKFNIQQNNNLSEEIAYHLVDAIDNKLYLKQYELS